MSQVSIKRRSGKPAADDVESTGVATEPTRERAHGNWQTAAICVLLVIAVFAIFGRTLRYGFVNYDDEEYVYGNPVVSQGLSLSGIQWAFTHTQVRDWVPLTAITHMADCQFYKLWGGGHHLTNLFLHAAAAVLLFLLLLEMTGAQWRSAFVAALFAIHPLRVESVAWISERKDVLSGLFFMLTLWAYTRYARRPSPARYAMVALWFALGLMSKGTLMTLPFLLLLLDFWPLKRLQNKSQLPRLLFEKIPLFALTAAAIFATMFAFKKDISSSVQMPLLVRLGNASAAYIVYLGKLIWPTNLAVLYPRWTYGLPAWQVASAIILLVAVTAWTYWLRKRQPSLITGWLWYLGMLVPVSGILQTGSFAYADRYTYLPQIGLCFAGTWAAADWAAQRRHRSTALGSVAAAILAILGFISFHQTKYWRNSITLWTHTIESTGDNAYAQNSLGNALLEQGQPYAEQAAAHYSEAFRINPAFTRPRYSLGIALSDLGRDDEAIAQFREALRIDPNYAEGHNDLGNALLHQGQTNEAIAEYREACRIDPANAEAHFNLGMTLFQHGIQAEGISESQKAFDLQPSNISIANNLAWMLATAPQADLRNGARAVEIEEKINQSTGGNEPLILRTLAAAYAENSQFSKAVQTAQKALQLEEAAPNSALAQALRREIDLYANGQRFEEPQ